jgi:hypothetical protein
LEGPFIRMLSAGSTHRSKLGQLATFIRDKDSRPPRVWFDRGVWRQEYAVRPSGTVRKRQHCPVSAGCKTSFDLCSAAASPLFFGRQSKQVKRLSGFVFASNLTRAKKASPCAPNWGPLARGVWFSETPSGDIPDRGRVLHRKCSMIPAHANRKTLNRSGASLPICNGYSFMCVGGAGAMRCISATC